MQERKKKGWRADGGGRGREGERQRGETTLGDKAADGVVRTESFRDTVMRREAECKRADESTAWENRPQKPTRFIPGNGCRAVTANNKTTAQQAAGGYLSLTAIIILHNHIVSFRISQVVRTGFTGRLSVCVTVCTGTGVAALWENCSIWWWYCEIVGGHWC